MLEQKYVLARLQRHLLLVGIGAAVGAASYADFLVLTDIMMPSGEDAGFRLIEEIRARPEYDAFVFHHSGDVPLNAYYGVHLDVAYPLDDGDPEE